MVTPPLQPQPVQMTYVDRPEISETYADLLGRVLCNGTTLRMEFLVNRMDNPQPGQPGSGKGYTACRVVIPLPGMMDMVGKLQNIIAQLQAAGVIIPTHTAPGPMTIN